MFAPLVYAVPGVIPEGITFLPGGPKTGKSWLSQAIGEGIASGSTEILGCLGNGRPRPVMYFALEDGDRRIRERSEILGFHEVPELFYYATQAAPDQVLELAMATRRSGAGPS